MTEPVSFTDRTANLDLPLLFPGQVQKEPTLNEAILRIDLVCSGNVEGEALSPPAQPVAGQVWIVAAGATHAFAGQDGSLAGWAGGSWHFVRPATGMTVFDRALDQRRIYTGAWQAAAQAVTAPSGGNVIDTEARTAIAALIELLQNCRNLPAKEN